MPRNEHCSHASEGCPDSIGVFRQPRHTQPYRTRELWIIKWSRGPRSIRTNPENQRGFLNYWREAEDPAAKSRKTLKNEAVVSSPERASSGMVAERFGESGRKRTVRRLCPREVIKVLTRGVSSWVHSVRVVSTTGPGRESIQLRSGLEISLGFCVSQRCR